MAFIVLLAVLVVLAWRSPRARNTGRFVARLFPWPVAVALAPNLLLLPLFVVRILGTCPDGGMVNGCRIFGMDVTVFVAWFGAPALAGLLRVVTYPLGFVSALVLTIVRRIRSANGAGGPSGLFMLSPLAVSFFTAWFEGMCERSDVFLPTVIVGGVKEVESVSFTTFHGVDVGPVLDTLHWVGGAGLLVTVTLGVVSAAWKASGKTISVRATVAGYVLLVLALSGVVVGMVRSQNRQVTECSEPRDMRENQELAAIDVARARVGAPPHGCHTYTLGEWKEESHRREVEKKQWERDHYEELERRRDEVERQNQAKQAAWRKAHSAEVLKDADADVERARAQVAGTSGNSLRAAEDQLKIAEINRTQLRLELGSSEAQPDAGPALP